MKTGGDHRQFRHNIFSTIIAHDCFFLTNLYTPSHRLLRRTLVRSVILLSSTSHPPFKVKATILTALLTPSLFSSSIIHQFKT
jgi:hypothetical protein